MAGGCDLTKTTSQLQARKAMVGTVLAMPPVDLQPMAIAGFDGGGFSAPDGGAYFDGGVVTLPPQTTAYVFFGTRTTQGLDQPPEPISDATVTLAPAGGTAVTLESQGSGNYSATSAKTPSFQYASGATYEFSAVYGGETFTGEVAEAPASEQISAFHPPGGFISQPVNTPLTFTRPDPATGKERNLGFVTVFPISSNGDRGEPTYTSTPSTPLAFLKLVVLPAEWKQSPVTIPGSAFPEAGKTYLVVFQSTKLGGPKSANLFTGSAFLAGTADVAVVRTQ